MQESFLHFIWKNQYFDKRQLTTVTGQQVQILHPGIINENAGPDFLQARVVLDQTEWRGAIEIHVKASLWYQHHHHQDTAYRQVILHVVWKQDRTVFRSDGKSIPTLELKQRIDHNLLIRHQRLLTTSDTVPCHHQLSGHHQSLLEEMMGFALGTRLEVKCQQVLDILAMEGHHWDAVSYRLLGRNFGFCINAEPFEELVKAVPLSVVHKVGHNMKQLEALYFGQAGFLDVTITDRYFQSLKREYQYLLRLFPGLSQPLKKAQWKFLRLRPANFPTLRIAQFCGLIHAQGYRFWQFREVGRREDLYKLLEVSTSDYWRHHYNFGKKWPKQGGYLGRSSKINILINTVMPLRMAHSHYQGERFKEQAMEFLKSLPIESNRIVRYWKERGFKVTSAYHSQAILALHQYYCTAKMCMHCKIGKSIIAGSARV